MKDKFYANHQTSNLYSLLLPTPTIHQKVEDE